jgi:hypothetical protein
MAEQILQVNTKTARMTFGRKSHDIEQVTCNSEKRHAYVQLGYVYLSSTQGGGLHYA